MLSTGGVLGMEDQRRFITVGELGTAETIGPDLAGQLHLFDVLEFLLPEEVRPVGEAKDGFDA